MLILSDNDKSRDFYDSINSMIKVDLFNGEIDRISSLNKLNFVSESPLDLESLKSKLINEFSIQIDLIIKIDKILLGELLNTCLIDFQNLTPLSLYKFVRKFKTSTYFDVFPELPIFAMLKKKRFISYLKTLLAVLIDRHEF